MGKQKLIFTHTLLPKLLPDEIIAGLFMILLCGKAQPACVMRYGSLFYAMSIK